jgi:hypothetical protein
MTITKHKTSPYYVEHYPICRVTECLTTKELAAASAGLSQNMSNVTAIHGMKLTAASNSLLLLTTYGQGCTNSPKI